MNKLKRSCFSAKPILFHFPSSKTMHNQSSEHLLEQTISSAFYWRVPTVRVPDLRQSFLISTESSNRHQHRNLQGGGNSGHLSRSRNRQGLPELCVSGRHDLPADRGLRAKRTTERHRRTGQRRVRENGESSPVSRAVAVSVGNNR